MNEKYCKVFLGSIYFADPKSPKHPFALYSYRQLAGYMSLWTMKGSYCSASKPNTRSIETKNLSFSDKGSF
jgi:hypothetical protein